MIQVVQVSNRYTHRNGEAQYKFCIKEPDRYNATIDWLCLGFKWQLGEPRQYNDIFYGGSK